MTSRRLLPAVLLGVLCGAATADAASGPCLPGRGGPPCHVEYASVVRSGPVNDGDTIFVRRGGRSEIVRMLGVQAFELTTYHNRDPSRWRGECRAVEAGRFLYRLMRRHRRVRLASPAPARDRKQRLLRAVAVRKNGRWRDVGEMLMARGHTLWLHHVKHEPLNRRYNLLGQRAAARDAGLWAPEACGRGPEPDAQLALWVMSDPIGADTDPNTEYIAVRNRGPAPLDLSGWHAGDAAHRAGLFRFPAGTTLAPGQTLRVHSGAGVSTGSVFHRGLARPVFENSIVGFGAGDGAYLFDPRGNVRAHMLYPCLVGCTDPDQATLRVSANPARGAEYVLIRNVSDRAVDLYGRQLRLPGAYAFGEGSVLAPGETMQVFVKGDPRDDTRLVRHIGYDGAYLRDAGGAVSVSTFDEIVLGCDAWGDGRC